MKVVGLITEYNPFHNGHFYHMKKAKEITEADAVIVVMSGDFVQRGAPALLPKHMRAEQALRAGADLVIELPVCFACGSAEYFSVGAVSLLNALGCVDALCFGSECGDITELTQAAEITAEEPTEYKDALKQHLSNGLSFPAARQMALRQVLPEGNFDEVLKHPNNILGIEYLKALLRLNSRIKPFTISRTSSEYHEISLRNTSSSATAIRNLFGEASRFFPEPEILTEQMPPSSFHILKDGFQKRYPVFANDFSSILKYKLLTETSASLQEYLDVTPEIANRIRNSLNQFKDFEQFCSVLKTRELTYSRISRCLLHILLNIKKEQFEGVDIRAYSPYAHILGFRKKRNALLTMMHHTSSIPLITKPGNADTLSAYAKLLFGQDLFASNLYESIITDKFRTNFLHEYQKQMIII